MGQELKLKKLAWEIRQAPRPTRLKWKQVDAWKQGVLRDLILKGTEGSPAGEEAPKGDGKGR